MILNFDPYQVFNKSKTPAGLYARQKWLDQSSTKLWKNDFNKTIKEIQENQLADGSWEHSFKSTINHLFSLHLTVREGNPSIYKGLEWLINLCMDNFPKKRVNLKCESNRDSLDNLPFQKGCSGYLLYASTLFLASIFSRGKDNRIIYIYECLDDLGVKNNGRWCGWNCSINVLRAFVVNPDYSQSSSVKFFIMALGKIQDSSGRWGNEISFYQTLNALAHLKGFEVDRQLNKAFKRIAQIQNPDGTWGVKNFEWNTFLVVHALRNKGII